ncbi:MAG: trypsin-like peptidase domain-containing protein [Pirellulales bacterium]
MACRLLAAGFILMGTLVWCELAHSQSSPSDREWTVNSPQGQTKFNGHPSQLKAGKLTFTDNSGPERVVALNDIPDDDRKEALASVVGSGVVVIYTKDVLGEDQSFGSGFVFHKSGLILTNYHVISGAGEIFVEFRDAAERKKAECLAVDRLNDVAVIRVEQLPGETHVLQLKAKHTPKPGDDVWTVGHPNQLKNTTSWGDVNAYRSTKDLPKELKSVLRAPDATRWIQTDAVITHGSSGSPLLNSEGQVIGMNTFVFGEQIGFALQVSHASASYQEAKKGQPMPLPIEPGENEPNLASLSREMAPIVQSLRQSSERLTTSGLPRAEMESQAEQLRAKFRQDFLAVVKAEPKSWAAFQGAYFILNSLADETPQSLADCAAARQVVLDHHLNREDMTQILRAVMEHGDEDALKFCREVKERSTIREIQPIATAAVAVLQLRLLGQGADLNLQRILDARKQVEQLAVSMEQDYKDLEDYADFGKAAAKSLREQLAQVRLGLPAGEIKGVDINGEQFTLSGYQGKVVLLDFFADWCPHCKRMYAFEQQLVQKYQDQPFALVGVNTDNQQILQRLVDQQTVTWRCWADGPSGPIAEDWQVGSYPTMYLIDQAGIVRRQWNGVPKNEEIIQSIETLLAETKS